jgi:FKBP-type peptidyl-prolyl cis-trans isomerase SlyD
VSENIVANNKVITLTYMIYDETGIQEQSDLPISYLHGENHTMFPKIAESLEGKKIGDKIEVELSPEEGFGVRDENKTFSDVVDNVPPEFQQIGSEAEFQNEAGEKITMTVVKIENGKVYLDGNHQFAGKSMTFKITITDIRDASEDEISSGKVLQGNSITE